MKVIFKNLFSLSFVHGVNLLIPLLVTPYLIKTIGVRSFGIISTAQSIVGFFVLFVDFGFNITSVRRLAQANGNKKEIEVIINGVLFVKLILLFCSFFLFFLLVYLVPQFRKYYFTYLFSFAMVVGQALLPIWYYQGIEKVHTTIIPIIIFKLITIGLIFYTIQGQNDAPYVNLLFGAGNFFTGIFLLFLIQKDYKISLKSINVDILKSEFKGSFAMFIANISVLLYTNSSLLILSFFVSASALGVYSIVDKIMQMLKALLSLIHQVTYPRLCHVVRESEQSVAEFIKKVYSIIWAGVLLLCILLFFESEAILSFFVKDALSVSNGGQLLRWLSFILFIISLNMPFYQSILAYKKDWLAVKILLAGALLSILANIILVSFFNISGAVITMYVVEATVTYLLFYFATQLKKNHGE